MESCYFSFIPLEIMLKILQFLEPNQDDLLKTRLLDRRFNVISTELIVEYLFDFISKEMLFQSKKDTSFQIQLIQKQLNEKKEAMQMIRVGGFPIAIRQLMERVCQFSKEMIYLVKLKKDLYITPKIVYVPSPCRAISRFEGMDGWKVPSCRRSNIHELLHYESTADYD